MLIEEDKFYINKTTKYVIPLLRDYGNVFMERIQSVFKLAIGINDSIIPESMNINAHVLFLININREHEQFLSFIKWIRIQPYFKLDYVYDDIISGYQHMIVIKVPKHHLVSYNHFINSSFSEMLSKDNIENYFTKRDIRYRTITKDEVLLQDFVDFINKEYDVNYTYEEWKSEKNQIEFPIVQEEEIFNYTLI